MNRKHCAALVAQATAGTAAENVLVHIHYALVPELEAELKRQDILLASYKYSLHFLSNIECNLPSHNLNKFAYYNAIKIMCSVL